MGSRAPAYFTFFFLWFSLYSGSSIANRQSLKAIKHDSFLDRQERLIFSPSVYTTELAATQAVPIVNPTPDTSPIFNPPSPPSPISTMPTTTPTAPPTIPQNPSTTPTAPQTNPQNPMTTPTTPPTNPQNPVTTPTTPPTNPQNPMTTPTTPPTSPQNPMTTPTTPPTNPQNPATTPTSSGGSWCIAKPDASQNALQVGLDYACGYGGADCSNIQPGASCYNPNSVKDHASYAFNSYYHKHPGPNNCDFGGIAQLTNTDPSSGNCHYASSTSSSMTTPANTGMTPPATTGMTPPSNLSPPEAPTLTTPTTTFPGGSSDFGAEPTGLPSSANSKLCSLLLLMTSSVFVLILPANSL